MPKWLHRTDIKILNSVPSADLPEPVANYIEEPDLSAVTGQPNKYWIITGDIVTLMDQAAMDVVDAAIEAAALQALRDEAISRIDLDITTRETVEALLFEINKLNTRMQEVQDSFTAMKLSTGGTANLRLTIPDPSPTTGAAPTSFLNIQPKLRSQILQTMVDDINAGTADP